MSTISRAMFFFIFSCTVALFLKYGVTMLPMEPLGPLNPPTPSNPMRPSRPWRDIAVEKRRDDNAKIPAQWRLADDVVSDARSRRRIAGDFIESLLDNETRDITSVDAPDLVDAMANGSLTALKVVTAFCKRAAYSHQLVSPLALRPPHGRALLTTCPYIRAIFCLRSASMAP